jgi:WD40 repeat protein
MTFTSNGLHLITGGHDGIIKIFDVRSGYKLMSEIRDAH